MSDSGPRRKSLESLTYSPDGSDTSKSASPSSPIGMKFLSDQEYTRTSLQENSITRKRQKRTTRSQQRRSSEEINGGWPSTQGPTFRKGKKKAMNRSQRQRSSEKTNGGWPFKCLKENATARTRNKMVAATDSSKSQAMPHRNNDVRETARASSHPKNRNDSATAGKKSGEARQSVQPTTPTEKVQEGKKKALSTPNSPEVCGDAISHVYFIRKRDREKGDGSIRYWGWQQKHGRSPPDHKSYEDMKESHAIPLDEKWIESNFGDRTTFQGTLHSKPNQWLKIPQGNRSKMTPLSETNVDTMTCSRSSCEASRGQNAPEVWCPQEDDRSCVMASMASAVHAMGYKQQACELKDACAKSARSSNPIELLLKKMGKLGPEMDRPNVEEFDAEKFCPLSVALPIENPILLVPCGSLGNVGHAVALYDRWIFDSSEKMALPICQESLDICCGCKFKYTFQAIKFY